KEGEERGEKKGEEKKTVADIQRLIKKLGYTEEQAMNFMDIPAEEHSKYALLLNEKAVSYEP
ncbi:hypothetical protein RCJ22_21150, partial [Vibrio sp. FNV 38]|nr:hypothetical protein [Vibrio sp. FNV 38]